jgi:hypothetical protein
MATTSKTSQVTAKFLASVNNDTEYTQKELTKLFEVAYKEVYATRKRTSTTGEKKPPSAYNLFIKAEIEKIKAEGVEGVDPKDYMKMAAQRWKAHKEQQEKA